MRAWQYAWIAMLLPSLAFAESSCPLTPKLTTINYPGVKAVPTTNNLLAPTGKSIEASGQRVVLMGRVLDQACMPVANATVEIWQVDPFGKWILATPEDTANPYPTFAGAGRTYTDNDGNFSFITAFPAALKNRAPNINLRVNAEKLPPFSTVLYFAGDMRNAADATLKQISAEGRQRVMLSMQPLSTEAADGQYGSIDIVLPGKQPYRTY